MTDDKQNYKTKAQLKASAIQLKVAHPADPLIGALLDHEYQIDALIGSGATSNVYVAREATTGNTIAIKVLHSHLIYDDGIVGRFLEEAENATILHHANIARVYKFGQTESDQPYFVMEFVPGITLRDFIRLNDGILANNQALNIFIQICAALAAAHQVGIVHRDLKPENIMIVSKPGKPDFVKVVDFGVAKIMKNQGETHFKTTQTGETMGSILYMSPEQCLDQDVDARSDIYALGCVMYESLTGKPPICGRTAFLTMNQHLSEIPASFAKVRPDLSLPPQLERLIFKAMAKDPSHRQQSISQLQDELIAVKTGKVVHASVVADSAISSYSDKVEALTRRINQLVPSENIADISRYVTPQANFKPSPKPTNVKIAMTLLWVNNVGEIFKILFLIAGIFGTLAFNLSGHNSSQPLGQAISMAIFLIFCLLPSITTLFLTKKIGQANDTFKDLAAVWFGICNGLLCLIMLIYPLAAQVKTAFELLPLVFYFAEVALTTTAMILLYSRSSKPWFING